MKRFLFVLLVLCLVVAVAPMAVIADEGVCNDVAYHEGFYLYAQKVISSGGWGAYPTVELYGRKTVDEDWRQSVVWLNIQKYSVYADHRLFPRAFPENLDISSRMIVPIDPDWLEVSCDLGWAGLDTTFHVYDKFYGRMVTVELHLDLYGKGAYWYEDSTYYFKRNAGRIRGTISIPEARFFMRLEDLELPPTWGSTRTGYNFSTQWAG